jgi:transposase InsO family protein
MVGCVIERGWSIEATAERFQVDAKTVRKWRDRFIAEGDAGLSDRSCRPHRSPNRTPDKQRQRVVRMRKQRRWGAEHIGAELGMAPSTVQSILRAEGLGRLDQGDRATAAEPVKRYQRGRPGELVHVDVKKIAAIPKGGGWRMHGKEGRKRPFVGYRYIHTVIDDRTRVAYSEIHGDETTQTAIAVLGRATRWFAELGVTIERVLSDNGTCYKKQWDAACAEFGITPKRTRFYRPQTNGKVERFHRILLEEWAYIRDWTSETARDTGYHRFMHFYNQHRSHGALEWQSPMATLKRLAGDNVPGLHT